MPDRLPTLNAFVVAPDAFGNTMYRDLGEDDVMHVVAWAIENLPIDPQKVSITGHSMGGIGAASIPFHHPGLFSAAEPLSGYHSYFIRRDYGGRPVRPWERLIAEERSNVSWAYNAYKMPIYIAHGKKDLPESNSGVLIDRLNALGYWVKHEHPDIGHVETAQKTYEGLKGLSWVTWHKKDLHSKTIRMRTVRPRFADNEWVHIQELAAPDEWGQIEARVRDKTAIDVHETGLAAFRLDRDAELVSAGDPILVRIDGQEVEQDNGAEPLEFHKQDGRWSPGPAQHAGAYKHGEVTGPLRDVFHSPLVFVWGADDPNQARINEEVAKVWARMRWGVTARFPVMSDAEFVAAGEKVDNDRALFLVGNAKSNRIVRELEGELPIQIDGDAVVIGGQRITGNQVGAAFVRPNPKRTDRYVVVVEGVDALGTWRSMSLPDMLPDFIVYDADVAPARGQQLLSAGLVRAGGFFKNDWSLPADFSDPSAGSARPGARSEHDATPYLP
jgi:predicted esterase